MDKGWEKEEEKEAELMHEYPDLGWRSRVRRANVHANEAVDLGEDAHFREWLLRLRRVQVR